MVQFLCPLHVFQLKRTELWLLHWSESHRVFCEAKDQDFYFQRFTLAAAYRMERGMTQQDQLGGKTVLHWFSVSPVPSTIADIKLISQRRSFSQKPHPAHLWMVYHRSSFREFPHKIQDIQWNGNCIETMNDLSVLHGTYLVSKWLWLVSWCSNISELFFLLIFHFNWTVSFHLLNLAALPRACTRGFPWLSNTEMKCSCPGFSFSFILLHLASELHSIPDLTYIDWVLHHFPYCRVS